MLSRAGCAAAFIAAAGLLSLPAPASPEAGTGTSAARFPYVPTGKINPAGVNVLSGADADRTGEFMLESPLSHLKTEVVHWQSDDQALHWKVFAPEAGDYSVTALLRVDSKLPVTLTVGTPRSSTSSPFRVDARGFQSRSRLDEPLHLDAGWQVVTLKITAQDPQTPFDARFLALELTRPAVREALHAEALAGRADARWMGREPLGLAFTWTKRTMPRKGPQKPYGQAVADFDVEKFTDQVASTGATFVVLTTSHSDQYIPGPNKALDAILPGRTARRDLIADLISALGKRHIKLFLYYHLGPIEDPAWSAATHMWDSDPTRFFDNWKAIISEMGARYGKGLAGWWFDDGLYNYYYRSPDWAALARAAKVGNPDRPICFNSWSGPSATEFQDYFCGEETTPGGLNDFLNHDGSFNGTLVRGGDGRFTAGQFAGLQAATMFVVENDWIHSKRDTEAAPPKWTPESLAKTLEMLQAYHVAPMVNPLIYQDGTIAPKSLEVLREAERIAAAARAGTAGEPSKSR